MRKVTRLIIIGLTLAGARLAGSTDVAFLRGTDVVIVSEDGASTLELRADARPKGKLRWLPWGNRLSYIVKSQAGGKARLVVIDLTGQIVKEIEIRPLTDPPTEGLRFVEDIDWVSEDVARIGGSINPKNCEIFDLSLESQKESNWQMGACGTFAYSPDGKHIAYSALEGYGPTEVGLAPIEIDGRTAYRPSLADGPIISPVVWSPDSLLLAFVEQGEAIASVCIVALDKSAQVVHSPFRGIDGPPAWSAGRPVVRAEGSVYAVDLTRGAFLLAPDAIVEELGILTASRLRREELSRNTLELARRLGGREWVLRPSQTGTAK